MADELPARKPSPTSLAMGERLGIGERRSPTKRRESSSAAATVEEVEEPDGSECARECAGGGSRSGSGGDPDVDVEVKVLGSRRLRRGSTLWRKAQHAMAPRAAAMCKPSAPPPVSIGQLDTKPRATHAGHGNGRGNGHGHGGGGVDIGMDAAMDVQMDAWLRQTVDRMPVKPDRAGPHSTTTTITSFLFSSTLTVFSPKPIRHTSFNASRVLKLN